MHVVITQPEMMTDLVDQDVADQMLKLLTLLDPFSKDRLAEKSDPVGERTACLDAALTDRDAFVNAGEVERVVDAQFGEQGIVGKFIDLQDDMVEVGNEWLGQFLERIACNCLDFFSRRWVVETARHGVAGIEASEVARQACPLAFLPLDGRPSSACGAVAEWSKALAWKVSIRQNRIEGSNPSRSATLPKPARFLPAIASCTAFGRYRRHDLRCLA